MTPTCQHPRTRFYRRPHARGEHLVELCLDCRANVRGPGAWVPRREVADPQALPLVPAAAEQPTLFDLEGLAGAD